MKGCKKKTGVILLSCVLLTGCGRETEAEISGGNAVEDASEPGGETAEAPDTAVGEDDESGDAEGVTKISVLGKTELTMENSRIYDGDSLPGILSDCFTSEERDVILDTVWGIWEIDGYAGFVPYDSYVESGRGKTGNTEQERRDKYEKAVEKAETVIPDFSFRIKVYNAAGEEPGGGQYIYVRSGGGTYASPVGIDLCFREADSAYPVFAGETLQGVKTGSEPGYPVVAVRFFCGFGLEEEGRDCYEPAAFLLTSDGRFLLAEGGAFYTMKQSVQSEIMHGDFRHLDEPDDFKERIDEYYNMWIDRGIPEVEWQMIDINGDGTEDMILQNRDATYGETKPILGIFACEGESAKCVEWDLIDMTEYSFCGPTGELMYTAPNYGQVVDSEPYVHYYYDREWNKVEDYTLKIIRIDSAVDEEYAEIWKKEHPDFAEDGIYYRKYAEGREEVLTREEMEEMYETATGYKLDSGLIRYSE